MARVAGCTPDTVKNLFAGKAKEEYQAEIEKTRARHDIREKRQTVFVIILLVVVFLLIGAFIALWTYDVLNPTVNWIRKQIMEMSNNMKNFIHDVIEMTDWIMDL